MSGHSKWSTIKRQKGIADIKKGMVFTKFANAIAIAAKAGGSDDSSSNSRLREALEAAHKINMPKENIKRAIDRGMGNLPGQILEEVVYEGYGPQKVAFYIEGVTDNKLRTNQLVKNLFERAGGSLGGTGSTAYLFERMGEIKVKGKRGSKDDELLELIDLGAADVEDFLEEGVQKYLIYIKPHDFHLMSSKLTQIGYETEESEILMKPTTIVTVTEKDKAQKVLDFTEKLEEMDDIQKVHANFEIPDDMG